MSIHEIDFDDMTPREVRALGIAVLDHLQHSGQLLVFDEREGSATLAIIIAMLLAIITNTFFMQLM